MLNQFVINRLTLSFPKDVEKTYQQANYKQSLPLIRKALLIGIAFYSVFGILDYWIFPEVKHTLWIIRYAIIVPYAVFIYLISFSIKFAKYYNILTASAILLAGLGIIAMILIAPSPTNSLYYAGLILIFIYGYTLLKIRFIWASTTGWLIVLAYEIAAIWLGETPLTILLSNNFFFLGGNIIGMFASYSIESYSRQDFIKAYLLENEKKKVDTLNRDLENSVEKRTEQLMHANEELIQEMMERREAEEKYLTLFEESKDAVFITTPEGRFLDLNPAGVELLGYSSREEILEIDIARDIYINPEDRRRFEELIQKQGHVKDLELHCERKDGKRITVLETATAVRNKEGKIIAYQGIIRDITEKMELERQLFQSQKMESIGLLAGGIAHDLNNVLAPITMAIQLLQERFPDDESNKLIEALRSNVDRGADIVGQVLTFARGVETELSILHIKELIEEITSIAQHTFPKTIEIVAEIADDLQTIKGNATQLHQVLLNLCVNARDAMKEGGRLSIEAENFTVSEEFASKFHDAKPGQYVKISVIDHGIGMPPHILERIFEPFFTTKDTGKGTGLGLSVIHSIIKGHNGFIDVQSKVGKGSNFMVYLPVGTTVIAHQESDETEEMPGGNNELVLIIDDEESMRILSKEILENYHYRTITAKDGREALAIYRELQSEIKVIMTDLMMPEMDGPATIQAVRGINKKVPIIAMSGLATDEQNLLGDMGENVQASIAKPFSAGTLLRTIHRVIQGKAG
ncbi:MAG: PAS domain S-box protein [Fidelibacterota bacterium]|nr:MAG: PAS domain S-box protein [Candidatus Neomarinimicrobiota bacterium]